MTSFHSTVRNRFGVLPNFFCTAQSAPGLIEELWGFARSAYLENPMPSLFKERLLVHLSRFCEIRYCIVRHVGFLISRPAGDEYAHPETVDQVIDLLKRPIPDAGSLIATFKRMLALQDPGPIPEPETEAERDLFDALTVVFLEPTRSERARGAVKAAVGEATLEGLTAFLSFVRVIHFWSETHPELSFEPDVIDMMNERPDLAVLLVAPSDAEQVKGGKKLRQVLDDLQRAEAALRESETRFRALVLAGAPSVFRASPDWQEIQRLEGVDFLDDTAKSAIRWLDENVDVDDQAKFRAAIARAIQSKEAFELEHRIRHADGTVRWVLSRAVPIIGNRGEILEWFGASSDISARKEAEAKLMVNDERLQMALSASGNVGLWDWMVDTDLLYGDANFARLYGLDVDKTAAGLTMEQYQEFVVPEDIPRLRNRIKDVFDNGDDFLIDYRLALPDQLLKWVECKGKMIYDASDKPLRFSGTAIDITERKAAEHQKHLLMQEMSHRVNNTFAVIQAIAMQSLRGVDREIVSAFQSRLIALSRAHDVLLKTSWAPTPIDVLLQSVLRLQTEGHRYDVAGPEFNVGSKMAVSMSLLLHELSTNAIKYGSLSVEKGKVVVRWTVEEGLFRLTWREVGGPPAEYPSRNGFGTKLIAMGLGGATKPQVSYGPEGVSAVFESTVARAAENH